MDSSGTGRTTSSTFYGSNGTGPSLIFYLTGAHRHSGARASGGLITLYRDRRQCLCPSRGAFHGVFLFEGPYATDFTAFPGVGGEDDGTGEIASDGISAISGTVDVNYNFSPASGQPLSGSYTANSNGRFTGSLTAGSVFSSDPEAFYIINANEGLFVETDAQPALGLFETSSAGGPYGDALSHQPHLSRSSNSDHQSHTIGDVDQTVAAPCHQRDRDQRAVQPDQVIAANPP